MVPIWKFYYIDLSSYGSPVTYRVTTGGEEIFRGDAYERPDGRNEICINDICAAYLRQTLPTDFDTAGGVFGPADVSAAFSVDVLVDDAWTPADSVTFAYDWSYDEGWNVGTMGMNLPIRDTIDARLPLVVTLPAAGQATVLADDTAIVLTFASAGNGVIRAGSFAGAASVTAFGRRYPVRSGCGRYALLYVNAFGGWDIIAMERGSVQSDASSRSTAQRTYDNRTPQARQTVTYRNDIARSWRLSTGPLSDAESERFHHLAGSVDVYLYDIETAVFTPVTVADGSVDVQTYRNQGRRFADYTITVREARSRERR